MKNLTEGGLDFLLYSYFEIIGDDSAEDVKLKCADRAYRDLARTVKYSVSTSELEKMKKGGAEKEAKKYSSCKNEFVRRINKMIADSIDLMPDSAEYAGEEQFKTAFDSWHHDVCDKKICNESEKAKGTNLLKEKLTYGQAQKWLNMTIKYLWLLGFLKGDNKLEHALHVPVDSYIIEAASAGDSIKNGLHIKCSKKGWSEWNEDTYRTFQTKIRAESKVPPIRWEGFAWIEVAEKRKQLELEKQIDLK